MGVADNRRKGCDGCDRSVVLGRLTTVSMPDGTQVACCPTCTPHARAAAARAELDTASAACEGCRSTVGTADVEDVVLTDGTVMSLCSACRARRPNRGDDGTGSSTTTSDARSAPDADVAASTEIAPSKRLCGHCREWIRAEPYRVTLVDDRVESLCPTCKETAVDEGIVVDVAMRRVDAREILDVDEDASAEEIRVAFQEQVKHAHPDRPTGTREAFRLVRDAYERLK
ncbi:heat shock protein DnaJ domain-containing protein [Halovivax asiaticus JCM 14624]|uniref:Heat shock protein DnaJ domain-containing protein n=1 Tax=Halovivax asiaticus JCM 14624 TaxID=1227490 RepID=M0BTH4_9EURY|nr:J domain-containing protein [Halovivax asiaticus]ELZ14255.1 heat shock protein DnaJ domain-containing protein [Halovivax asiaticus JCM 14624]